MLSAAALDACLLADPTCLVVQRLAQSDWLYCSCKVLSQFNLVFPHKHNCRAVRSRWPSCLRSSKRSIHLSSAPPPSHVPARFAIHSFAIVSRYTHSYPADSTIILEGAYHHQSTHFRFQHNHNPDRLDNHADCNQAQRDSRSSCEASTIRDWSFRVRLFETVIRRLFQDRNRRF